MKFLHSNLQINLNKIIKSCLIKPYAVLLKAVHKLYFNVLLTDSLNFNQRIMVNF